MTCSVPLASSMPARRSTDQLHNPDRRTCPARIIYHHGRALLIRRKTPRIIIIGRADISKEFAFAAEPGQLAIRKAACAVGQHVAGGDGEIRMANAIQDFRNHHVSLSAEFEATRVEGLSE